MSAISNSYSFRKLIWNSLAAGRTTPLPAAQSFRELVFLHALIYYHRQVAADGVHNRHQLLRRRVDHVEQFGKYDFLRGHRRQLVDSLDVDDPAFHQAGLKGE